MGAPSRDRGPRSVVHQRGQAIFLTALIVLMGVGAALFATLSSTSVSIANRQAEHDARMLAQVKEALIAWSAARTPTASNLDARPGELPCPDTDNNGYAENDDNNDGVDTTGCVAGAIGRVPWKTLGIPEPRDSTGETLWYAVSGNFRIYRSSGTASHIYTSPITSDTLGTLTVYQNSTASTLTSQAAAVLFAPGLALSAQDRSTTATMSCSAPSGTYLRNQCASNYLETLGGVNNAANNGPYIQGPSSSSFNDRVLAITNADLMPLVEQRVAREMVAYLNAYKAATSTSLLFITLSPGVYPWADLGDGNSNASAAAAYNRNRFPCGTALPVNWGASMAIAPFFGSGTTPTLPNWLTNGCATVTGWAGVVYYAVARDRLEQNILIPCTTCTAATLTVNNTSGLTGAVCSTASPPVCSPQVITSGSADMLLITVGGKTVTRGPPGGFPNDWPTNNWTTISVNYIADTENRGNNDDTYVVPSSTSHNRNRIYVVR